MRLRHVYLVLCVLGLLLPYPQFAPWLLEQGPNLSIFVHDLFANRVSGFSGPDVLVSAIVLFVLSAPRAVAWVYGVSWLPVVSVFPLLPTAPHRPNGLKAEKESHRSVRKSLGSVLICGAESFYQILKLGSQSRYTCDLGVRRHVCVD